VRLVLFTGKGGVGKTAPELSIVRLVLTPEPTGVAAGQRRWLPLPSGLRRCVSVSASAGDGAVRIRFHPDPQLRPRELADGAR
jgi:hypothetical protein